jgi:Mor family transcriptional regulator
LITKSAHELIEVIGYDAAIKLFSIYGGEILYIPKFKDEGRIKRNQLIKCDRVKGASARALAVKYKLSLSSIFSLLRA